MARFTSLALVAVAAFQGVTAQDSTEVGISVGDLQTTLTLPAFPTVTPAATATVVETSVVYSGMAILLKLY